MYYPKSQIKTNLTTVGREFVLSTTKEEYQGGYWKTSKGTFYTGNTPNDGTPIKLIPIKDSIDPPKSHQEHSDHTHDLEENLYLLDESYYAARGIKERNEPPRNPISYSPPINVKFTERYFVAKTNEIKFIEVSKKEYQKFISKSSEINWTLFDAIKVKWKTDGTQAEAYIHNKTEVIKQNIPGFELYFRGKFDKYWVG